MMRMKTLWKWRIVLLSEFSLSSRTISGLPHISAIAGTTNELNPMKNALYNCKDIVCISLLFYITVCTIHYCVHRFNQGGADVVEHYWEEMKTESCLFQTVCFHLVKMCDKKITQVICAAVQRPGWIRGGKGGVGWGWALLGGNEDTFLPAGGATAPMFTQRVKLSSLEFIASAGGGNYKVRTQMMLWNWHKNNCLRSAWSVKAMIFNAITNVTS